MALFISKMTIHSRQKPQIAFLLMKKVIILEKYFNFADVFLEKLVEVLLKRMEINKHIIKFNKNK